MDTKTKEKKIVKECYNMTTDDFRKYYIKITQKDEGKLFATGFGGAMTFNCHEGYSSSFDNVELDLDLEYIEDLDSDDDELYNIIAYSLKNYLKYEDIVEKGPISYSERRDEWEGLASIHEDSLEYYFYENVDADYYKNKYKFFFIFKFFWKRDNKFFEKAVDELNLVFEEKVNNYDPAFDYKENGWEITACI